MSALSPKSIRRSHCCLVPILTLAVSSLRIASVMYVQELGPGAEASAHYSVMLHAANNNRYMHPPARTHSTVSRGCDAAPRPVPFTSDTL